MTPHHFSARSSRWTISLRWVLMVPFVIQMVVIVGVIGYGSYRYSQSVIERLAQQVLDQASARIRDRLDTVLETQPVVTSLNKREIKTHQSSAHIETFLNQLNFSPSGKALIVDSSGHILAASRTQSTLNPHFSKNSFLSPINYHPNLIQSITTQIQLRYGSLSQFPQQGVLLKLPFGEKRYLTQVTVYGKKHQLSWLIITMIPESDLRAKIWENLEQTLLLSGLALSLAIGTIILTTRWINQPIQAIIRGIENVAKQQWQSSLIESSWIAELTNLTNVFNRMLNQLHHSLQEAAIALQESQEKYKILFQTIPFGIAVIDSQGAIIEQNHAFAKIVGSSASGHDCCSDCSNCQYSYTEKLLWSATEYPFAKILQDHSVIQNAEVAVDCHDNHPRTLSMSMARIPLENYGALLTYVDITNYKEQERWIYQQGCREILLRKITERIHQSLELQTIFDTAVREIRQFLRADRVAILKFDLESLFEQGTIVAESVITPYKSVINTVVQEDHFAQEYAIKYQKGRIQAIADIEEANLSPCHVEFLSQFQVRANLILPLINDSVLWGLICIHQCSAPRVWQDEEISLLQQITHQLGIAIQQAHLYHQAQQDLVEKNELFVQLNKKLEQQKILLKEIHHRVKNNLQIMSSLLYLQFSNASQVTQELIEVYQNRIQSMALIHEQLYRSEDLASINFDEYITNLSEQIFQSYSINPESIRLNLVADKITIALDQSIPLGLIIHELISNSIKYAFPNDQGEITIKLIHRHGQLHLTFADNGVGILPQANLQNTDSLGMQLIYNLTEQLQGTLELSDERGLTYHIIFPCENPNLG